jgi:hypothetical protein
LEETNIKPKPYHAPDKVRTKEEIEKSVEEDLAKEEEKCKQMCADQIDEILKSTNPDNPK